VPQPLVVAGVVEHAEQQHADRLGEVQPLAQPLVLQDRPGIAELSLAARAAAPGRPRGQYGPCVGRGDRVVGDVDEPGVGHLVAHDPVEAVHDRDRGAHLEELGQPVAARDPGAGPLREGLGGAGDEHHVGRDGHQVAHGGRSDS
jgi:hypothetical protein